MYRDQEQRDFARQLRNNSTPAETRLWHLLRNGKLGVKFRRQAAIGAYIVDFVCFSHRLIVELDGPQHVEDKGKDHDARRTAWLASRGFRVIRFRNQALDGVFGLSWRRLSGRSRSPSPALPQRGWSRKK
jgi:very-short-patch-repair endonuclease